MQIQSIINKALRKIGVLGAGRTPRDQESDDALETFVSMLRAWITAGTFGRLTEVVPTEDYTAGENERIYRQTGGVLNITLPALITDDDGTERPPRDCSVVVIIDAFIDATEDHIYDGQRKRWYQLNQLGLTDDAPLSFRDANGLASCLALALADEYGQDVRPATLREAAAFQNGLTHNWSEGRDEITPVDYF
ncbi:MAG TPA: hypothetical protein VGW40_05765 [Allosphingosinicella sp.]|nr:hypothetical protein [Allosphingosinicella sp.]